MVLSKFYWPDLRPIFAHSCFFRRYHHEPRAVASVRMCFLNCQWQSPTKKAPWQWGFGFPPKNHAVSLLKVPPWPQDRGQCAGIFFWKANWNSYKKEFAFISHVRAKPLWQRGFSFPSKTHSVSFLKVPLWAQGCDHSVLVFLKILTRLHSDFGGASLQD
jgi:hypothetical protein